MAKVLGVGGVFFKAKDPKALGEWYARWLGIPVDPSYGGAAFNTPDLPPGAYTVWSPFNDATEYFEPSEQRYLINLIVDDVRGALAQVVEGGGTTVGDVEDGEFGVFGWFLDPEGNKVELWTPAPGGPPG